MVMDAQTKLGFQETNTQLHALKNQIAVLTSQILTRNVDSTANINMALWAECALTEAIDAGASSDFTVVGNGIRCEFAGLIEAFTHIKYTVNGSRVSVHCRFKKLSGGVATPSPVIGATGYVRNAGGHTETSISTMDQFAVAQDDVICVETTRGSEVATITQMDQGASFMRIRRLA